jgi:uncharacterized membrane protein YphA (DoxX/SURF4 family)
VLLALPFVLGGFEAAREPGPRVGQAAAVGVKNPELAVRANGITMVIAGLALASGRLSRWAAAVLALVLVPTTIAGHAFWKETDPKRRKEQIAHFLKNLAMIGGLLEVFAGRKQKCPTIRSGFVSTPRSKARKRGKLTSQRGRQVRGRRRDLPGGGFRTLRGLRSMVCISHIVRHPVSYAVG